MQKISIAATADRGGTFEGAYDFSQGKFLGRAHKGIATVSTARRSHQICVAEVLQDLSQKTEHAFNFASRLTSSVDSAIPVLGAEFERLVAIGPKRGRTERAKP